MERNLFLNRALVDVVELVARAVGDGPDQIGVGDYAYSELGFVPGFIQGRRSTAASWLFCAPRVAFSASGIPP
jgi:hypothetical protein